MGAKGGQERSDDPNKNIAVIFYRTEAGGEPVREWLKKKLTKAERKLVGEDIKTVELGWPIGMPVCRPLGDRLYEVRTQLPTRITRVLFYVDKKERMVLLHGLFKTTEQLDNDDLKLARGNKSKHERGMKLAKGNKSKHRGMK
jgi:phage-related protein